MHKETQTALYCTNIAYRYYTDTIDADADGECLRKNFLSSRIHCTYILQDHNMPNAWGTFSLDTFFSVIIILIRHHSWSTGIFWKCRANQGYFPCRTPSAKDHNSQRDDLTLVHLVQYVILIILAHLEFAGWDRILLSINYLQFCLIKTSD